MLKKIFKLILFVIIITCGFYFYNSVIKYRHENELLKKIISRFEADSRIAEVLVTDVKFDAQSNKNFTTIKFLEYDVDQKPLPPKYFTFCGNIIQFQSMVVRFQDRFIRDADVFKGKSIYLFWKVFMLDGKNTQEFVISPANEIPAGYKLKQENNPVEEKLWEKFWDFALNPKEAEAVGIKNAQIEAPGTKFIPGNLYTIKIEHDGGLRIDVTALSPILRGEKIL